VVPPEVEQWRTLNAVDDDDDHERRAMIEFVRGDLAAVGRTTMFHPDHDLKVTLYPVFHVGSPAFYKALSDDLVRFHVFLLEGIRWRGWRGPVYDLVAGNLGLVTQREHLVIPAGSEQLRLDMTEAEFEGAARMLPIRWRLPLRLLRPLLWGVTRTEVGRHMAWDKFSKSSHLNALRDVTTPLDELIKTKRDQAMSDELRRFVEDPARVRDGSGVAVVAGAAHMPALYLTLRDCGYQKGTVRWFEVLDGIQVPSRSTDGRAPRPTA
jgi:hypothetical protein